MGAIRYFRGQTRVKITGASIEHFLNTLTQEKVVFWDIQRQDELHYIISLYSKSVKQTQEIALRCFCNLEILGRMGFDQHMRIMRKRPFLLLGMLLALMASFYLQGYVWAIEINGNEALHDEEIMRALDELDIQIGSSAGDIDQQLTKHRMLNLLPQLSWIGVNRSGFKLNVLVTERSFAQSNRPNYPAANIVSVRDSVITEVIVTEGMRLCKVGDAVKSGQILVSGFEDYGLILKGVCAEAEIYGQTWYSGMVVIPSQTHKKSYTGNEWTQYTLIVGRKRINLCGNSGISGTTCDKMISVTELSVPDYAFPVSLEKITYREYELMPTTLDIDSVQERLTQAWEELILSQMIAGQIINTEVSFMESGGVYVLQANSTCKEMIARLVPMEPVFEGETNE